MNKLVRDLIPKIIERDGKVAVTRILNDKEYFQELLKKLHEELAEFEAENSLEELADIQEVVNALAEVLGGKGQLEQVRSKKAEERGGFKDRIFLEDVA